MNINFLVQLIKEWIYQYIEDCEIYFNIYEDPNMNNIPIPNNKMNMSG